MQGYKRLLTVFLLGLNVLLSPLLEIAAHWLSFFRVALVTIAMAPQFTWKNHGRTFHRVLVVYGARKVYGLLDRIVS